MSIYNWQEEYSVQIKEIDDQHRELVEMIDELYTTMVQRRSHEVLGQLLDRLVLFCDKHFAAEEALLQAHDYPYLDQHKEIHDKMRSKVRSLQQNFKSGKTKLTIETSIFLKDWLDKHILGTDHKYAPFLNAKGVK